MKKKLTLFLLLTCFLSVYAATSNANDHQTDLEESREVASSDVETSPVLEGMTSETDDETTLPSSTEEDSSSPNIDTDV